MQSFLQKHFHVVKNKFLYSGFQKYLKNTSWLLLSRVVIMVVSFLVGAYVARYLGPQNFGTINYVLSFVGLFSILANLGIDSILVRDLVNFPDQKNKLLGSGFIIKLIGGISTFFLVVASSFFLSNDIYTQVLILLFSFTMILQSMSVIECYFQANVLAKKTAIVQICVVLFSSLIKIIFIHFSLGIGWFVFSYVIDAAITSLGLILSYRSLGLSFKSWQFDLLTSKHLVILSLPLILSGVMSTICLKIDQVMIGYMLGSHPAGIYAAAVKISEIWYFIPGMIITSVLPAIINARKENISLYYSRFKKLYLLMFVTPLLLSIIISFFSKEIIQVIFGASFANAASILTLYVWAGIPVFISTTFGQYLVLENATKIVFIITACGAISNILLNLLLIPAFGISGAAYATLISYSIIVVSGLFFSTGRKHFREILV